MKTKITTTITLALCVIAISGLALNALSAANPDETPAKMYRIADVSVPGYPLIKPDVTRNAVRNAMGSPDEKITPNIWLYHSHQPKSYQVRNDDCHELLIAFSENRVSYICRVNPRARDIIVARVNTGLVANNRALAAVDITKEPTMVSDVNN